MRKFLITLLALGLTVGTAHADIKSWYNSAFLGLNSKANPRLLKDTESPTNQNYNLDETGGVEERSFFGKYNTSSGALGSNPVTHITKLYKSDGTKYFVSTAGSIIASGSAGAWSDISNADGISTSTAYWYSATLNDSLLLANEDNILQDWNGTSSNTVSLITPFGPLGS